MSQDLDSAKHRVIDIYRKKGFSEQDCITLADILCKDKMTVTELLLAEDDTHEENVVSPSCSAAWTFVSFIVFGLLPLLTFVLVPIYSLHGSNAFWSASILTGFTLWLLGAMKAKLTMEMPVFLSGTQDISISTESSGDIVNNEVAVVTVKKGGVTGTEVEF